MNKNVIMNILGIVTAFAIAFGSIWLMQNRLEEKKAFLLNAGGEIAVLTSEEGMEISTMVCLTEEGLIRVVNSIKSPNAEYPHEPFPGQLTMQQAIDSGKEWLEDIFIPHLKENLTPEYDRANAWLCTKQEEGYDNREDFMYSYWTVSLEGGNLKADLVLNAMTGQVLDAVIDCGAVGVDSDGLLLDYADSFGFEGSVSILNIGEAVSSRSIGNGELFATLETGDGGSCHLYLEMGRSGREYEKEYKIEK